VALTALATLLLASCGGGSKTNYVATQMFVLGDESSLLVPGSGGTAIDAKKYSVNGYTAGTTTPDCNVNPLWVQTLARQYGLVFAHCNPTNAPVTVQMLANSGAKVADVVSAIDALPGGGTGLTKTDLVTILVGANDILELYASIASASITEDAGVAEAVRRGEVLAAQFDRVTKSDNSAGRALYVPIPDLGDTPYGRADSTRQRILKRLSERFNATLRSKITNNGRSIGLVDAYQLFQNIVTSTNKGGFANVTQAACTTGSVLDCTTNTLQPASGSVAAATATSWLWADDRYLSPGGQTLLGNQAASIARNNPF
jgi:hypothetical protein